MIRKHSLPTDSDALAEVGSAARTNNPMPNVAVAIFGLSIQCLTFVWATIGLNANTAQQIVKVALDRLRTDAVSRNRPAR